jgi:PPOX class probable F420-dependent enzyme
VPDSQRSRITAFTDSIYDRIRHRDAWSSASADTLPPERGFESLRGQKYCLLTTFRKSGEPVPTPVWFGLADGNVYVRSEATVGKMKRIRNDPRVRVAPCTLRGRPLGAPAEGHARILAPDESDDAERAIAANYGLVRTLYEAIGQRFSSVELLYIEVEPAATAQTTPTEPV